MSFPKLTNSSGVPTLCRVVVSIPAVPGTQGAGGTGKRVGDALKRELSTVNSSCLQQHVGSQVLIKQQEK